jgi:hypothetical protein
VTLTGVGTVVLQASQAANANYAAATATTSFMVTATAPVVPTLSFASIAAQIYGNAPFAVSATSASSGAVTYAVVGGPATISGLTVTLTGVGTVVLSASQAASGKLCRGDCDHQLHCGRGLYAYLWLWNRFHFWNCDSGSGRSGDLHPHALPWGQCNLPRCGDLWRIRVAPGCNRDLLAGNDSCGQRGNVGYAHHPDQQQSDGAQ